MKLGLRVAGWKKLLESAGAEASTWTHESHRIHINPQWRINLRTLGIEVGLEDIVVDPVSGLFTYNGQQVMIYINQPFTEAAALEANPEIGPRFHLKDCRKISEMKEQSRYQRYVALSRTDGMFPILSRERDRSNLQLEVPLKVCRYCLAELNFRNYSTLNRDQRTLTRDRFSIADFFAAHESAISVIPRFSCDAIPANDYSSNWQEVSFRVRKSVGWRCYKCSVLCEASPALLQAHHVDRVKSNNLWSNLVPLCLLCHSKQPGHKTMYVDPRQAAALRQLYVSQGITELTARQAAI